MILSTYGLYTALCLVSVTLHVSRPYPTLKNPSNYGLNTCSGVFISPNEVLTAAHCVANSRGKQWIKTDDGKSYAVTIVKKDVVKDLALLSVTDKTTRSYAVFGQPADIADKVFTVNSGEEMAKTYNEGIVNNFFEYEETNTLMLLHSATMFQGASGSGLFNSRGQLVGINTDTLKSLSGAVDISEIRQFLKTR